MKKIARLKVAVSAEVLEFFETSRKISLLEFGCLPNNIAAAVLTKEDCAAGLATGILESGFNIPVFILDVAAGRYAHASYDQALCTHEVERDISGLSDWVELSAQEYERGLLPPFLNTLIEYASGKRVRFTCPGHQGADFFLKHPAGRKFLDFFGENILHADVPHADPVLGSLLSHEGPPGDAEKYAANVFNSDRTYFILNGTSASNKVVANALLAPGDIVLFDRNNHKSCHHGALILAGASPLYLEASRNVFGLIGGIPERCFEEDYLRTRLRQISPERAEAQRPFRLAIFQAGTWDGTVYNAQHVIDKVGHLCDYILFDSAWLGYEQFVPIMRDCSPLLLTLDSESPGIVVTQSVHKQMAGFSQASQIHVKDFHIRGQVRRCSDTCFNNSFMLHASTSPFYPIFASLDVNSKIHAGENGPRIWQECVRMGIEVRKLIFMVCSHVVPFVPPMVEGVPWYDYETETIANEARFFKFKKDERWHGFAGYGNDQYLVDPCKLLLTTPGISADGDYEEFGVPASILAYFLRDRGVVPEKSDLNSILFLITPALTMAKLKKLVNSLRAFERHLKANSFLIDIFPMIFSDPASRFHSYRLRDLCQEMHSLYRRFDFNRLQRKMFEEATFPSVAMSASEANFQLVRGNVTRIPLANAEGKIAAVGGVPYPPGIICIVPGERWGSAVLEYFKAIEVFSNEFPVFGPDVQGVDSETSGCGRISYYVYVVNE